MTLSNDDPELMIHFVFSEDCMAGFHTKTMTNI